MSPKEMEELKVWADTMTKGVQVLFKQKSFVCTPEVRFVCSATQCEKMALNAKDQKEYLAIIGQAPDGQYIWVSRENTPLQRDDAGIYSGFSAGISGFIKISAEKNYMEVMGSHLSTFQYFGRCN